MSFYTTLYEELQAKVQDYRCLFEQHIFEVQKGHLYEVLAYLQQQKGFSVLMDLSGVDYLLPEAFTKVVYWLHRPEDYLRLRVIVCVKRTESLPSVVNLWEGANWYERELYDLFGVQVDHHPNLTRILMPDEWQGHPLRKDYALTEEVVAFKHHAQPKEPSAIIHVKNRQKL